MTDNQIDNTPFDPKSKIVLLVDDDSDVLYSTAALLEIDTEYTILTASSIKEVKQILEIHTPDLALLDIQLGQESGLDLIPILREKSTDMICTMITAYRDVEHAVKAVKLGATEYLFKPVVPEKLISKICKQLQEQNEERLLTALAEEMLLQSKCDHLTGLPGRELLNDHFNRTLSAAKRSASQFAVLFIDLDHFKQLNDTLGHTAGDTQLINVAKELQTCIRDSEILARVGGDEFVVVLREGSDFDSVEQVVKRVVDKISNIPMQTGQEIAVTTSIGVALYPQNGQDIQTLLEHADQAMYRAKNSGRNNYSF